MGCMIAVTSVVALGPARHAPRAVVAFGESKGCESGEITVSVLAPDGTTIDLPAVSYDDGSWKAEIDDRQQLEASGLRCGERVTVEARCGDGACVARLVASLLPPGAVPEAPPPPPAPPAPPDVETRARAHDPPREG